MDIKRLARENLETLGPPIAGNAVGIAEAMVANAVAAMKMERSKNILYKRLRGWCGW